MLDWIKTYALVIVTTLLGVSILGNIVTAWMLRNANADRDKLNVQLGVVAGLSQNQEVKVVESKKTEEKLKLVYQDKIQVVKEYVYDENKSDCDNSIDVMRTVF